MFTHFRGEKWPAKIVLHVKGYNICKYKSILLWLVDVVDVEVVVDVDVVEIVVGDNVEKENELI